MLKLKPTRLAMSISDAFDKLDDISRVRPKLAASVIRLIKGLHLDVCPQPSKRKRYAERAARA